MLLVKTKIGLSSINGIGLFADQFISKGTPTWKFQKGFDLEVDKNNLEKLSEPARKQFLKYAYLDIKTDKYVLCFDDARFFNHADDANTVGFVSESGDEVDVATRDIERGEELTCNYREFDADFGVKMEKG